ncbi:Uncharacterized protein APZ42_002546 [Daphnia magna]|uniref:Uncharacterized protein n=1 Tax=Daphnia magna TaxID=35525 RepID=A0A164I773_9CRUS|nr:Uncharacterized protein APZ42_002546 [Daphnia magna]
MGATFKLVEVHASSVTSRSFCSRAGKPGARLRLHFTDWIIRWPLRKSRPISRKQRVDDVFCAASCEK